MFSYLRLFFSVPADKPELALAQYEAFRKQVPLLYLMLVINTVALVATHMSTAPWYLTIAAPCVLYAVSIFRLIGWLIGRTRTVTASDAIKRLKGTLIFTVILGAGFTTWALSLYGYGSPLADMHIAFYMSITIIGCIFCLMHLRAAAMMLVVIVLCPFTVFFLMVGDAVFTAITVNILLVGFALMYILNIYYKDFAQLIASRKELLLRQVETQQLSDDNLRLANLDSLTGLANRRWFLDKLDTEIRKAVASGSSMAIGMLDLDGFKPVNDAYGHAAGDKVLIEVGKRLTAYAEGRIEVARLGGDEFGFIITDCGNEAQIISIAARMIAILQQPYHLPAVTARIGASAGVVIFPEGGATAEVLFEHADYALYHAKQTGRGSAVVFTAELATEIAFRSRVEQELKRCDLQREFTVAFQPLWSVSENRTFGFEALARWESPVLGAVRPDIFIPVAERCGMMGALSEVLFAKALGHAAQWPQRIMLSCNMSAKDVESVRTLDCLLSILEKSNFPPSRLDLELTETAVLENMTEALSNLGRLRARGIGVVIDDFGVGQSSLGHILRLPITEIKIDRSFVDDIAFSATSQSIVRTILDLARNLNCKCLVEGVESELQATILQELGCNLMQGFYFGRPMSPEAALMRLAAEEKLANRYQSLAS